ncbi:MAG: bifunctional adenosylcobinamide kinase/adenosylcobinamide-phosphate guanylyltransferase [Thermodesulfobacteriota bacterium]
MKPEALPRITLVTGGTRSGKSAFAMDLALSGYSSRTFIATGVALDREMEDRIAMHRKERGERFRTLEEPIELARVLSHLPKDGGVALVDCLAVWLGNLYHHTSGEEAKVRVRVEELLVALNAAPCDLILVTSEVGWGIVPENPLARSFRDMAGYLNRKVAEKAGRVYLVCMGIPLTLKGEG